MFCPKCGNKISGRGKFCAHCGSNIPQQNNLKTSSKLTDNQSNTFKCSSNAALSFLDRNKRILFVVSICLACLVVISIVIFQVFNSLNLNSRVKNIDNQIKSNLVSYSQQDFSSLGNSPDNNQNGGYFVPTDEGFVVSDGKNLTTYTGNSSNYECDQNIKVNASFLNVNNNDIYYYDLDSKNVFGSSLNDISEKKCVFKSSDFQFGNVKNICVVDNFVYVICSTSQQTVILRRSGNNSDFSQWSVLPNSYFKGYADTSAITVCCSTGSGYSIYVLDTNNDNPNTQAKFNGSGSLRDICINNNESWCLISGSANSLFYSDFSGNRREVTLPFKATSLYCIGKNVVTADSSGHIAWYPQSGSFANNLSNSTFDESKVVKSLGSLDGYMVIIHTDSSLNFVNPDDYEKV